ncbi:Os04g0397800, partial [Oryza sativa Japonica Group]
THTQQGRGGRRRHRGGTRWRWPRAARREAGGGGDESGTVRRQARVWDILDFYFFCLLNLFSHAAGISNRMRK